MSKGKEGRVSFFEKLSYGLGDTGCNFVYYTAGTFLTLYYTDVALIGAAFVGTMMLLARIFDGISDIIMGNIIDRTNHKLGKARPWILWSAIPLCVSMVLMFNVPANFGMTGKEIYAFITYFLMSVIFYTAMGLASNTLNSLISDDPIVRTSMNTVRFFLMYVAIMVISGFTNTFVENLGGGQIGWRNITLIYAAIAFVLFLICVFGTKERVTQSIPGNVDRTPKIGIIAGLRILTQTKYFYILVIAYILNFIVTAASNGAGIFYSRDVLGNAGYFGIITMACTLPCMISMFFVTKLVMKLGKKRLLLISCGLMVVGYAVMFIGNTLPVVIVGSAVRGFGMAAFAPCIYAGVADVVDYLEIKKGVRLDGMTYSVVSFGTKVGSGLGSAILGWMLAWGGYDATLTSQPATALTAMSITFALIPVICFAISFILMLFFNVEKDIAGMRETENH